MNIYEYSNIRISTIIIVHIVKNESMNLFISLFLFLPFKICIEI